MKQLLSTLLITLFFFLQGCEQKQEEPETTTVNRLSGTFWQLESYGNRGSEQQDILISTPYTLDFRSSSRKAGVIFDCQTGDVSYSVDMSSLHFTEQHVTQRECTFSGVAIYEDQERFIYEVIADSASFEISRDHLVIYTDNDAQLSFKKIVQDRLAYDQLAELAPFQSDGCSSFPDGTLFQQELWLRCCNVHDYAYWKGGSEDEREASDLALRDCVADVGEEEIALLMLLGVRVGGSPLFPTPYRWGYGWPYPKNYGRLSADELQLVEEMAYLQP